MFTCATILPMAHGQGGAIFMDSGQELLSFEGNASQDVALGDVDGDGDLDAVVAQGLGDQANVIWRNDGSGQFTESANTVGGGDSQAVALGDLDGDGDPDAWIGSRAGTDAEVWINQGGTQGGTAGTYSLGSSVAAGSAVEVVMGDLDGDTDLDVVVVGSNSRVWWNNGAGGFPTFTAVDAPGQGSLAVADLDADLDLDIVVGGEGAFFSPNRVLFNDGPGTQTFTQGPDLAMDPFATGTAIADLDGDTLPDIFFATTATNQVWWNAGEGMFTAGPELGSENDADVALADFDGDGDLDAFIARRMIGLTFQSDGIWLNNGDRTFTLSAETLGDSNSFAVALGDLNDDGRPDAFIAASGPNKVWLNVVAPPVADTLFADSGQRLSSSMHYAVVLGDVDGDGDDDAVAADSASTRLWVNGPPPTLTENPQSIGQRADDLALGDLDGDDDLDVFIARNGNRILLNQGGLQGGAAGQYADSGQSLGTDSAETAVLGDVDGDGDLDAVVCHVFEPASLWLNQGGLQGGVEGQFTDSGQALATEEAFGARNVALGDLDGDGDLDAVFAVGGFPVWLNQGGSQAGTPGVFVQRTSGSNVENGGDAVAVGDVDGDGDPDIVLGTFFDMQVWQNQGGDEAGTPGEFEIGQIIESDPRRLELSDLDEDGDLDIAALTSGSAQIWLNNEGSFELRQRIGLSLPNDMALGDLDGDGRPDLVFAGQGLGGNQVWLNRSADLVPVVMEIPGLFPDDAGDYIFFWTGQSNARVPVQISRSTDLSIFLRTSVSPAFSVPALSPPSWGDQIDFAPGETERNLTAYPNQLSGVAEAVYNPYLGLEPIAAPNATYTVTVTDAAPEVNRIIPDEFQIVFLNPEFGFRNCFLEGMQFMLELLGAGGGAAPSIARVLSHTTGLDLDALRSLRDDVLADTPQGRYYTDLYQTHSAELLTIVAANPALMVDAAQSLNDWMPAIQSLVNGQGGAVGITGEMAADALRFRDLLRSLASDEFRDAIDAEVDALDPDTWNGIDMSDLLGRVESRVLPAPEITMHPATQAASAGNGVILYVTADSAEPVTYQWRLNGADIVGATGAAYTLPSVQNFHAGDYTAVVTNAFGSVISTPAVLTVNPPPASDARLLNLSTRALALTGDDVMIPGFVITGAGSKKLLIRVVGPRLQDFGINDALADPQLVLQRSLVGGGSEIVAQNDDWGTQASGGGVDAITDAAAQFGAFDLITDTKSAAILVELSAGSYGVVSSGVGGLTGVVVAEVYADPAEAETGGAQLANLSNRGFAGTGANVMIPGFVVSNEGPKTVLLRAVGPTLGTFGVAGALADPQLIVFQGNTELFSNDDWHANADWMRTEQAASQVGAFALPASSKDAALVVTLNSGAYTVHGGAADGIDTGTILVEVYLVP